MKQWSPLLGSLLDLTSRNRRREQQGKSSDCLIPLRRRSRPPEEKRDVLSVAASTYNEVPQRSVGIRKAWSEITSAKLGSLEFVKSIDEGVGRSILPHFIESRLENAECGDRCSFSPQDSWSKGEWEEALLLCMSLFVRRPTSFRPH